MKRLTSGFYITLGLLLSLSTASACKQQLQDAIAVHGTSPRTTPRDVRVIRINDAWNERYDSSNFWYFTQQMTLRAPNTFKAKLGKLFEELDTQAKLGRIKNLNEWMLVALEDDAPVMSFVAEADYALYVLKQSPRNVVTFEPKGGFYKGNPRDVEQLGMRQKSIDIRISDSETGQVLALREVKSSAGRAKPGENFRDAFEKVRLVHHLEVAELSHNPVEIGLVYFYDYDPEHFSSPIRDHDFNSIKKSTFDYLHILQKEFQLPEKPFDTVTFMDFGSRRVFQIKRMADDSLAVSDFMLPQNVFAVFDPKINYADAVELRNRLEPAQR
jgi:hypothetical protein